MDFARVKDRIRSVARACIFFFVIGIARESAAKGNPGAAVLAQQSFNHLSDGIPNCPGLFENWVTHKDKEAFKVNFFMKWVMYTFTSETKASMDEFERLSVSQCSEMVLKGEPSPLDVEASLASYPSTKFNAWPVNFLNSCMDRERTGWKGKNYRLSVSDSDKRAVIGDFYWTLNKFRNQARANLEVIQGVDLVLGKNPALGETFWTANDPGEKYKIYASNFLPGTKEFRQKLNTCPALPIATGYPRHREFMNGRTEEFNSMLQITQDSLFTIWKLEQEKKKHMVWVRPSMSGAMGGYMPQPYQAVDDAWAKKIEEAKEAVILANAPWLKSPQMEDLVRQALYGRSEESFPPRLDEISPKLVDQLYAKRREIHFRLHDLAVAAECISKPIADESCGQKVLDVLHALPSSNALDLLERESQASLVAARAAGTSRDRNGETSLSWARNYMGAAQCRFDQRGNKTQLDSLNSTIAWGLATAPIGGVLKGLQVLSAGGRALWAARLGRVMQLAILGIDLKVVSTGVAAAAEVCDQALHHNLTEMPELLGSIDEPSCVNTARMTQLTSDYKTCVMQAALTAVGALAAVPGNLGLFKTLKTPVERLKQAGFTSTSADEILEGILARTADRGLLSASRSNARALEVLEQLGPRYAQSITNPAQRKALGEALASLEAMFGRKLKPRAAADLIRSLSKDTDTELASLTQALKEAKKVLASEPSLGELGALKKYLDSAGFDQAASEKLIGCLRALH